MQQRKGKQFEKDVIARLLAEWGPYVEIRDTRPEQAAIGGGRDLDLQFRGSRHKVPLCLQCSHAKKPEFYGKLAEAQESARHGELSAAIIRQDRKPIVVVMSFDDWLLAMGLAISKLVEEYNNESR
jgi:hypothetical protein